MPDNFFINQYKSNSNRNIKGFTPKDSINSKEPKEVKKFTFKKLEDDGARDKFVSILSKKRMATLFLILSGVEKAAAVVKTFSEDEAVKIAADMLKVESITVDELNQVESKFGKLEVKELGGIKGGKEYTRALLHAAFGISKGSELFLKAFDDSSDRSLKFLESLKPEQIIEIIAEESELVISIVLSTIDVKISSKVLPLIPKEKMQSVIKRMSEKIEINTETFEVIVKKLKEKAKIYAEDDDFIKISGKNKLLEILKHSDSDKTNSILQNLKNEDPALADELKENIFTFSDIPLLKRKDLEYALKNYPDKEIAFILKGAQEEMKNLFFLSLTKRRKELIQDEIKYLGEVKKSDVDIKRKEFVNFLRLLDESGKISLYPDRDKYVE
ncbi:MAG TPA: FliG C-terminal domain-containing protein [Spirochaetota bacterium]|nr:FliG C-terminal domain-containing protein [Spirochaetota bacterium]HOS33416.1 FliG C-terminal domain-containing protein [Spirochaetota bacterium]HOS56604.1 FliG C-terminal domain-containing protein [Spirochaetota bacterium]HPK61466.1 FliG C-terminal domain-containing protein [Spirochaetota bacterium]HQF77139.1 FliG C-terminal domain-containing protein [Spirochaetota bacterium]